MMGRGLLLRVLATWTSYRADCTVAQRNRPCRQEPRDHLAHDVTVGELLTSLAAAITGTALIELTANQMRCFLVGDSPAALEIDLDR